MGACGPPVSDRHARGQSPGALLTDQEHLQDRQGRLRPALCPIAMCHTPKSRPDHPWPQGAGQQGGSLSLTCGDEGGHIKRLRHTACKTCINQRLNLGHSFLPQLITPQQITHIIADIGIAAALRLRFGEGFHRLWKGYVHRCHASDRAMLAKFVNPWPTQPRPKSLSFPNPLFSCMRAPSAT